MCGLAGRFHPVALPPAPDWAAQADRALRHRGPDGSGSYRDAWCELVHRRLAIVDLSPTGSQPMANEDGDILVVFNGEIYNHRELRAELQAHGHSFRSTSDTEVLVHLYEARGASLVDRLRGIFAFALYDRRRRELILARDRFGVKPLFYGEYEGQGIFASEIKAILLYPGFPRRLDRQACYDFLGLGYVPEPATGFTTVQAVPPGTVVTLSAEGRRTVRYHETAAVPRPERQLTRTADTVAELLVGAIRRQSVADVPVAALLSGGIDSSLVVAAHGYAFGTPTMTFNVRFPDAGHDESKAALAVSEHYETQHHQIDVDDSSLEPDAVVGLLRHFDQPFADTSCIPMFAVSRAVRDRGIICTLSGDGGDEAFGGYQSFWRVDHLAALMRLPEWGLKALAGAGRAATEWTRNLGRQAAKAAELAEGGRRDPALLLAGLANYLHEDEKSDLVPASAREDLAPVSRHFNGRHPDVRDVEELSRRLTETMFAVSLPGDMLRKVDMMSMRAGIEVRVPLLDEELVAVGLSLPHRLKTNGRVGKLALRAVADRWLPRSVAHRPKHGFTIPLDVMLGRNGRFHEMLADLLLGTDSRTGHFLNWALVERWLTAFRTAGAAPRRGGRMSRAGLYQRVFILLSLELWLRDQGMSW